MLDFTRRLTLPSMLHYAGYRAKKSNDPITLALRSGPCFELRDNSSGNNDYGVAYEIFVHEYYNDHDLFNRDRVKLVVDLGANVGFSVLYFLHRYPSCRVIAFEPHPRHAAQATRNLILDGSRSRVELHMNAAGAKTRSMNLSDQMSSSSLIDNGAADTISVEVLDIFPILQDKLIDILKIDIEGGEYEILDDPRFEDLDIGAIVMEWHLRGDAQEEKFWCQDRLRNLGFSIDEIFTETSHGMFWARR